MYVNHQMYVNITADFCKISQLSQGREDFGEEFVQKFKALETQDSDPEITILLFQLAIHHSHCPISIYSYAVAIMDFVTQGQLK